MFFFVSFSDTDWLIREDVKNRDEHVTPVEVKVSSVSAEGAEISDRQSKALNRVTEHILDMAYAEARRRGAWQEGEVGGGVCADELVERLGRCVRVGLAELGEHPFDPPRSQ